MLIVILLYWVTCGKDHHLVLSLKKNRNTIQSKSTEWQVGLDWAIISSSIVKVWLSVVWYFWSIYDMLMLNYYERVKTCAVNTRWCSHLLRWIWIVFAEMFVGVKICPFQLKIFIILKIFCLKNSMNSLNRKHSSNWRNKAFWGE